MQLVKSATVFSFLLAAAACGEEYVYTGGAPDAPLPGGAVRTDMFADATIWKKPNIYRGALVFTQACGRVSVSGKISTNNYDTAWGLAMKPQPLTVKGPWYALSFYIASKPRLHKTRGGPTYSTAVVWYDAAGKEIAREPISLRSRLDERRRAVHLGRIPDAAARFAVNVGFDWPNLLKGDSVTLDSLDLRVLAQEPGADWVKMPDFEAPRVRLASASPFTDPAAELRVSVTARRPLDWSTLRVSVDGTDVTAKVRRDGNVVAYAPSAPWAPGLHRAEVKIADPEAGGMFLAKKTFFRGDPPQGVPHVTLRDDGVTLVDGKPFFPVGIYGVMKREYNGFDFDRGLRELAAGGFNLVHSYTAGRTKEFLDAAHRHGLKTWTAEYSPGKEFVETLRHHPAPIAWYVGDDTAMHFTPSEIYDRVDAIKAIDPYRITVQADGMGSAEPVTNYRPFVKTTDGFLPEIYPVRGTNAPPDPQCVAKTVRDMERLRQDVAEAGDGAPRTAWAIIQYFRGWTAWKRFPTRDELYAMSFAALAHGAHGITWYTYGGTVEPEKGKDNHGITDTPEIWCNMTNLATRIRSLSPALLERTPPQPPPAKILKGPVADALGYPSISLLVKRHEGCAYVITVNGTPDEITAEVDLGIAAAEADVLWENRRVPLSGGRLRDGFAPYAVHVYRLDCQRTERSTQ